jgi:hypothetical protein
VIIVAKDIPCSLCKAEPGEPCTYVFNREKRTRKFRFGCHSNRVWEAHDANLVANVLIDDGG